MLNHTFTEGFRYTHDNPYHDKLGEFAEFVLRDEEAELHQGKWSMDIFKREGPLCVEIGSGYGEFMMEYCEKNPDANFIGMDFRFKRSYALAKKLAQHPTKNFRYLRGRGERISFMFGESEVDKMFYFFPDPWPKKRQWKRRLFQEHFLECAHKVLRPGGTLFVKTDHDGYAEWMAEVIAKSPLFELKMVSKDLRTEFPEHFLASFTTKFERIFLSQGIKIKAFELTSKKEPHGP